MTLTELRYVVAVARERHFGRAADACFVSQPTLSVAIKKLEDELGTQIFERRTNDVTMTPAGERIVGQAQRTLDEAGRIKEIARQGKDPLSGPLRLGVIYTIGPYLLPALVRQLLKDAPQMPLLLTENFTVKLVDLLKNGEIDVAIMALPLPEAGFGAAAGLRRAVRDRRSALASMVEAKIDSERRSEEGNDAAARDRALLPGSGARSVPGVIAFLVFGRRNSEDVRRIVAGNDPSHGGLRAWSDRVADDLDSRQTAPRFAVDLHPIQAARTGSPRGAGVAKIIHARTGNRSAAASRIEMHAERRDPSSRCANRNLVSEIAYRCF